MPSNLDRERRLSLPSTDDLDLRSDSPREVPFPVTGGDLEFLSLFLRVSDRDFRGESSDRPFGLSLGGATSSREDDLDDLPAGDFSTGL